MNIQQERQLLQELLESGKLDSLSIQVIALNRFAESIGYKAVNGDVRKGFKGWSHNLWRNHFVSLEQMMYKYNRNVGDWYSPVPMNEGVDGFKIVGNIALQHNKKLGKLSSQKHWLKFVKE